MLTNVIGVPPGAGAGQISSWRAPSWELAALAAAAVAIIARHVPTNSLRRQ